MTQKSSGRPFIYIYIGPSWNKSQTSRTAPLLFRRRGPSSKICEFPSRGRDPWGTRLPPREGARKSLRQVADFETPFLKRGVAREGICEFPSRVPSTSRRLLPPLLRKGGRPWGDLRVPLTGPFGTGPREGRSESIRSDGRKNPSVGFLPREGRKNPSANYALASLPEGGVSDPLTGLLPPSRVPPREGVLRILRYAKSEPTRVRQGRGSWRICS